MDAFHNSKYTQRPDLPRHFPLIFGNDLVHHLPPPSCGKCLEQCGPSIKDRHNHKPPTMFKTYSWEVSPSKDKTKIIWSLQLMLLWEKYQVPKSCYLQIIPHFTKCFNHFSTRLPTKETRVHIAKVHGRNVGWHRRQEVGSYPETKEFFSEIQQLAPSLRGAFFLFLPHY